MEQGPIAERLRNRTAIVTGAAGGIGAGVARRLVAEGACVLLGDIQEGPGTELAEELGDTARFVKLDVTQEPDWARAVAAVEGWPPIRGLVNNAGYYRPCSIEAETAESMERSWRVNVLGPMFGIQAVLAPMRAAGGGGIVNVSSTAGLRGTADRAAYGSTKWALRGLTKVAASELGPDRIRVNSIHPGAIETAMLLASPTFGSDQPSAFDKVPLGRAGTTAEAAGLVAFLLSDDSSYVSGAEITVDGGLMAGAPPVRPAT